MKIKDLPKIERPREKLERYGPDKLSSSELLAIVLRNAPKGMNVIELSGKVLSKFKTDTITIATIKELEVIPGIGIAKACEIVACFELGRRLLQNKQYTLILSPKDVWEQLKDIRGNKKEHFVIFFLDTRNQEIKREIISVGSLNANLVHPREVFEPAVRYLAAQIIVAHNHPAGDPEPSEEDLEITKKLIESGKILGIEIIDHVIVTKDKFLSMKQKGILN